MRTHTEMEAIFNRAKEAGHEVAMASRVYNPAGLLCTEYTLTWNGHTETAHNTQEEVDAACERICDLIEAESA